MERAEAARFSKPLPLSSRLRPALWIAGEIAASRATRREVKVASEPKALLAVLKNPFAAPLTAFTWHHKARKTRTLQPAQLSVATLASSIRRDRLDAF